MKNVWVGTDWHVWSLEHTSHHPYQSVSNIRQLSDSYAKDIQVDDVFIYLGDLCDPAVTDLNELKMLVTNIPGYKILCKGNHDTEVDSFYKEIGFDEVCDICIIGHIVFSHFPIKTEPDMINIHGHLHSEKRSDVDDANHINAYYEKFKDHPIEISELIQSAYEKWIHSTNTIQKNDISDALTGRVYDQARIIDLTDIFETDAINEGSGDAVLAGQLSTIDTDERLFRFVRQNIHLGQMGKIKPDVEMIKSRTGSDFDLAVFVHPRLRKLGHFPKLMLFITWEKQNPKPGFVHLFNYWEDFDDAATWFEVSWRGHEGIYEFDSLAELKDKVLEYYKNTPDAEKYTETTFRIVPYSYIKVGEDPQELLKKIFEDSGLMDESLATNNKTSNILVNGVPCPDMTIVSSVDWFCNMLQIPNQVINIELIDNIRTLWAESIPDSSPYGGRSKNSISMLLDEKFIPEGFDQWSIKKFVCYFDILVSGNNNMTNDIAAAIAYWYSQPYYDQLFEINSNKNLQPSIQVQKAFNSLHMYQSLMNDTAVDLLVRELYWNNKEDPKVIISSAALNAMANTYGNQKTSYDELLSVNETTYDLTDYTNLIIPGTTTQRSPFNEKKMTSFVEDLLDANIKITPETIDKIVLKQVQSAQDLVNYYNSRLESFTDYSSNSYLGSADVLWTLLFNMDNPSINNWEKFIPTNLTEDEFTQYMNKRFTELEELEKMYQDIMINNIGAMRLSETITDAKTELDTKDSKLCKISTKKDGTVVYDYGNDLGKVFIASAVYNDDNDKYKTTIKPSRFFTRAHEYDYIIVTHGITNGNPNLWEIEHITVNKNACYMVSELLNDIGTDKKVLLLICNPNGKQIDGKYKNVTYSTNFVLDESAVPTNLNIHDTIQTKISIIKTKIKHLQRISKRVNTEAIKSSSNVEFGFIVVRNTNKKNLYPYLEYIKANVDFRHKYTHFAINDYIYALESAKTVFKWMDKIYFESMLEAGYYWTYQHSHCPIIMTTYDNPVIGGAVFSSIDECVSDAKGYLDDIHGNGEYTITIYEAVKGHPLPGQRVRINESTSIDSYYTKESMTITVPDDADNLNEILMEPEDAHLFMSDDRDREKSQKPYKARLSTDDEGVAAETTTISEEVYQLQGIDRKQQDEISKKYGIRAVGHETDDEREYREKMEKEKKERELLTKKKKKDKQLANARKAKKKYAKKRELEAKKAEFKAKFSKKNEDVDISDIPYNSGETNFFDNVHGVATFDFENETGYQFEMIDKVKFFDRINESSADNTLYPVYVLCVHTGTLLANMIKKATGSHFSHCTISFDSSLKSMYSFGRKVKMTELSNGSFVKESIKNPPYTNEGVTYALYCISVTADQIAAMKKRLEYFVKNKTRFRYDFAGLIKNYFGIVDNPEQSWFCSRFVADIINAGSEPGKPMIREPSLMRPEDFLYTNFAQYVTSGLIKDYDSILVDKITTKLLRIESIKRAKQRALQKQQLAMAESCVLDLNPYDMMGEAVFNYQLSTMDEAAVDKFFMYLKSFKIRLDKDGNVIIHRREVDQLDKYFREANSLLKANMKAGNEQGVVDQLCRVYYMIGLINRYYLNSTTQQNSKVKADLKKELTDLRSVMMNVFQQYLKWVTARNPQFNFQTAYDGSKYSDTVNIPNKVISDIGKALITAL